LKQATRRSSNPLIKKERTMNDEISKNEELNMSAAMISILALSLCFIMAPVVLLATYFAKAPLW
jgi:hypothetical protein